MKRLRFSQFSHRDVFTECIKTSVKHKAEYEKSINILDQPESAYSGLAEKSSLYLYSENWPEFKKSIMVKLYDDKFVKLGTVARKIYYDEIMKLAQSGICPVCDHLTADSLDHFLPKSMFPSLAVVPLNLYPCCTTCNEEKDTYFARAEDEQIFNPYFDTLEDIEWLAAELLPGSELVVKYFIKPGFDAVMTKRLEKHLKVYGLKKLYATQSIVYFNNNLYTYTNSFTVDGRKGLESEVDKALKSSVHYNLNSWTKVLLEALKKSDWFLNGDFINEYRF